MKLPDFERRVADYKPKSGCTRWVDVRRRQVEKAALRQVERRAYRAVEDQRNDSSSDEGSHSRSRENSNACALPSGAVALTMASSAQMNHKRQTRLAALERSPRTRHRSLTRAGGTDFSGPPTAASAMSVKKVPGSVRSFRETTTALSAVVTAGQAMTAKYQLLMASDAQRRPARRSRRAAGRKIAGKVWPSAR